MSVQTLKETLCLSKIVNQKMETIALEEDFVVPDIKPDILNVINTSGTVCVYKKELIDGKISLSGSVNTYVMYLADDESSIVRSLNVNLDFSKIIELDKVKSTMMLECKVGLKSIECKVLNGRKINVKAVLEIDIKISDNENLEFIKQINEIEDIQILNEEMQVNSLVGTSMTKAFAKDTLAIEEIDDLVEILKTNIELSNKEIKISYNKILIKADANVGILYLTQDNRINYTQSVIPVMGFIDMPNIEEKHICELKYDIKNVLIKPNSIEEHSIYVEIEIEVYCNAYETRTIDVIQDLYSPSITLNYKQKNIKALSGKNINQGICNVKERQTIEGLGHNKLYDVQLMPSILKQNILKNRIVYDGEIECKFIYGSDNSSNVDIKTVIVPFNYTMDIDGVTATSNIETDIEIKEKSFSITGDSTIELKIDLEFIVTASEIKNMNIIEEINIEETETNNKSSLVIYFVRPGDTLWKIAKRFKTSVDEIVKINNIENKDKINVGDQLFII